MEKERTFIYSYCASANCEVQAIREKYLSKEESKLDELKRLDREVQDAGMTLALIIGIAASMIFCLGLCMSLEIIGGGMILGILLGIVGIAAMTAAYPVGSKKQSKVKAELAPRILQLTEDLMSENTQKQ